MPVKPFPVIDATVVVVVLKPLTSELANVDLAPSDKNDDVSPLVNTSIGPLGLENGCEVTTTFSVSVDPAGTMVDMRAERLVVLITPVPVFG
jgi:hypothetical protein